MLQGASAPAPEAPAQEAAPKSAPKPAAKQQTQDPQQKPKAKLEAPPPPAASLQGPHTDVPHTQIRRIIAGRLLESKQQIPHLYVSRRADMAAVTELRKSMKQQNMKVWPTTPPPPPLHATGELWMYYSKHQVGFRSFRS